MEISLNTQPAQTPERKCMILNADEFRTFAKNSNLLELLTFQNEQDMFTKAETFNGCIAATMRIPSFKDDHYEIFHFAILADQIVFSDVSGSVLNRINALQQRGISPQNSIARFLYFFCEDIIKDDLRGLELLNAQIAKLQERSLNGELEDFDRTISHIRRKLSAYEYYYGQFVDMVIEWNENENGFFAKKELKYFNLLQDRLNRLENQCASLAAFTKETREIYQAQIDINLNRVMKVLTVVTTVFAPLTLLTGWYGMNFEYMPELHWALSYPMIIVIAALITVLLILYFKKKKFL